MFGAVEQFDKTLGPVEGRLRQFRYILDITVLHHIINDLFHKNNLRLGKRLVVYEFRKGKACRFILQFSYFPYKQTKWRVLIFPFIILFCAEFPGEDMLQALVIQGSKRDIITQLMDSNMVTVFLNIAVNL